MARYGKAVVSHLLTKEQAKDLVGSGKLSSSVLSVIDIEQALNGILRPCRIGFGGSGRVLCCISCDSRALLAVAARGEEQDAETKPVSGMPL